LGTGREAAEQFRAAMDQKYFLRNIKAMDSLLTGGDIVGAASILGEVKVERANPVLLILYGHRLAAGGSFLPAQSNPQYTPVLERGLTGSLLFPGEGVGSR
jgi:hypothetical protein